MIQNVVISGIKHRIKQEQVLGVGGEATVVEIAGKAVKIYHKPEASRTNKLIDYVKITPRLPGNVCAPQELAYDTKNTVLGFTMDLMPPGYDVVQMLSSKKFRAANPFLHSRFVTELCLHIKHTVDLIHPTGVVIGDFNDLNVLFSPHQPRSVFIDADSFQFGRYPCRVGSEGYLHPSLYDLDLSVKPYYTKEHDWYAFWAMFIKALLMAHPYGGVHPKYNSIPQRALAKLTILDSSVKYPKAAFSIDLLSDNLKSIVERIFARGETIIPQDELLADYAESLCECPTCKVFYPSERKNCPQCSTTNTQQVLRKVKVLKSPGKRTVETEELLATSGAFVWYKIYGETIFAIALEHGKYVLYKREANNITQREIMPANRTQSRFDMFEGKYLVVSPDQLKPELFIYDTNSMQLVAQRVASMFSGKRVFVCSKDHLIRVSGEKLFRGHVDFRHGFIEQHVASVIDGQTWLTASPLDSTVFGFQRVFNALQFFIYRFEKKQEVYTAQLDPLQDDESLLSVVVRFAANCLLCLIKTEVQGRTYARVSVVNFDGTVPANYRIEAMPSDTHRSIHGKAFVRPSGTLGIIMHPTEDGIVQEIIGPSGIQSQTLLSETEQFVGEDDKLVLFSQGMLVLGEKSVNYLRLV